MDPARLGELRGPFATAGCPIELDRESAFNVCCCCCCCSARDGGGREGLLLVVLLRGLVSSVAPPRPPEGADALSAPALSPSRLDWTLPSPWLLAACCRNCSCLGGLGLLTLRAGVGSTALTTADVDVPWPGVDSSPGGGPFDFTEEGSRSPLPGPVLVPGLAAGDTDRSALPAPPAPVPPEGSTSTSSALLSASDHSPSSFKPTFPN